MRMNELTREASKQTILEAISFLWLGGRGRVRKYRREPVRALQGDFNRYLTGLEPQWECKTLDDWPVGYFKWKAKTNLRGVDLDQFKRDCEGIDNET
jgi:hypothetical protein